MCSFVHHAKSVSRSNGIESSKNVRNKSFMFLENNKIMVKKTPFKKHINMGKAFEKQNSFTILLKDICISSKISINNSNSTQRVFLINE